jgi:hypothetical protein
MSFTIKLRTTKSTMIAEYECLEPQHADCGRFAAEVERDENGDPPELVSCDICSGAAEHRISAIVGRVRRVEVTRGKWEKPERKTYLDTRKLGEGQDVEEFQAERKKIWNERRHKRVKDLMR